VRGGQPKLAHRARALELVAAGMSRREAARIVGVTGTTVTNWLVQAGAYHRTPRASARPTERHCATCYGLPHRRPPAGLCECGEAYAPELLEVPITGLQSSAAWASEAGEAEEEP
jgi:hypothetical protein